MDGWMDVDVDVDELVWGWKVPTLVAKYQGLRLLLGTRPHGTTPILLLRCSEPMLVRLGVRTPGSPSPEPGRR